MAQKKTGRLNTVEQDNCATVRDRDTLEQVRMPIDELESYTSSLVDF